MRFIDPRTDFAFKKIFGSSEGLAPLKSFIEAVMGLDGAERLASLELVDPYQPGHVSVLKRSYLDVKAIDGLGRKYLIEMQVEPVKEMAVSEGHASSRHSEGTRSQEAESRCEASPKGARQGRRATIVAGARSVPESERMQFAKRVVYNAAKAYVGQLESGRQYWALTQVIAISVCDFIMFPEFEHHLSRHHTKESVTGKSYLDELRCYFLELPKFSKTAEALDSALDKWTFFLRHAPTLEQVPEALQQEPYRTALHIAERAQLSPQEWEAYDEARIHVQTQQGKIEYAKDTGFAEGKEEGIEIGRKEGVAEGLARALLSLLEAKGLAIDEHSRTSILETTDSPQLERWLRRALSINELAELFTGD
ncbi:MAG: Rpn family recombination-promoting nuclease/putative transposase [Myxococcota bacterium]|jgi:predicted transposase/invertase (TIGR01784 family)|nr:Rpn family recombination-promoting nuclease/putative transposase [Myxococcota bacterium]